MLSAPVVCAESLFAEADVTRLLADTQTSSSLGLSRRWLTLFRKVLGCVGGAPVLIALLCGLLLLQLVVAVASLVRPLAPVRGFDSPAPSSALRGGKQGFQR